MTFSLLIKSCWGDTQLENSLIYNIGIFMLSCSGWGFSSSSLNFAGFFRLFSKFISKGERLEIVTVLFSDKSFSGFFWARAFLGKQGKSLISLAE